MSDETQIQEFEPEHTLDYYVEARGEKKRNYIFRYKDAETCDHPEMKIIARGGNLYRCTTCNYAHQWPGAITWPLHFTVIQGAQSILQFAKEFGASAMQEVLRRPIGTTDGTPHKPVLPEGKSFVDVLELFERVDTTVEDGGKAQLESIHDMFFVGTKERALEDKRQAKMKVKQLEAGNEHGNSNGRKELPSPE